MDCVCPESLPSPEIAHPFVGLFAGQVEISLVNNPG
jgi:hypothetical protein